MVLYWKHHMIDKCQSSQDCWLGDTVSYLAYHENREFVSSGRFGVATAVFPQSCSVNKCLLNKISIWEFKLCLFWTIRHAKLMWTYNVTFVVMNKENTEKVLMGGVGGHREVLQANTSRMTGRCLDKHSESLMGNPGLEAPPLMSDRGRRRPLSGH